MQPVPNFQALLCPSVSVVISLPYQSIQDDPCGGDMPHASSPILALYSSHFTTTNEDTDTTFFVNLFIAALQRAAAKLRSGRASEHNFAIDLNNSTIQF